MKLFGTSGIRKKVSEFPADFAENLGKALGTFSQDKKIAVGMDTRASSPQLEEEFIKGVLSTGKDVVKLGIVPTPTLALAARDFGTGVMITASHNPPEYNGFKFWGKDGAYRPEQEKEIERIYHQGKFLVREGGEVTQEDYISKHLPLILERIGRVKRKVRIFLDCANGSGSLLTPRLLEEMGCEVIVVNTEKNGKFPHPLEPTSENLKEICDMVRESDVDLGLVHDGDADRTAAISKEGELISWDSFLAILAFGKRKVITTVDASQRMEEVCQKVIRVPVGDVAVATAILKEQADFGGEPSGSFIFPEFHLFPDGPLTAAITVKLISEGKFYPRLERIPDYPLERLKIPCPEGEKIKIMEKLKKNHNFNEVDYTDGVRVSLEDGWFLIRPSGTEPFMRITAEGKDKEALEKIITVAKNLLKTSS